MIRSDLKYLPLILALFCVSGSIFFLSPAPLSAEERPGSDTVEVLYRGMLQDVDGDPISGLFPLTFKLYRGSMSAEPVWQESHFVSVVDGRYQVSLGRQTPLREHIVTGERWVGIELGGEGEILRDRILVERPEGAGSADAPAAGQQISHADLAERARIADNALALDGMSADDIEELSNLALRRLGEHMADPNAHSATARYRIGSERRVMDRAGGSGGTPYSIRCPAGYIVTGIEGSAGRLLDSITVVCSPLQ